MVDYSLIERDDREDGITTLTLNQPRLYNALSLALLDTFLEYLEDIDKDHGRKVVIIAAKGRGFSSGHDLKELMSLGGGGTRDIRVVFERCATLMLALLRLRQPVIAQVQGIATAAGCQLVATCDLAVAGESARFATSGINFGLFCSTPMVALTRIVSRKAAMEMLITGEFVSAQEACDRGLINRVVADEDLVQVTQSLAQSIAHKPSELIFEVKKTFYHQISQPMEEAYAYCCQVMTDSFMTDIAQEGITTFLQRTEKESL